MNLISRSYVPSNVPFVDNISQVTAVADQTFVAAPDGSWGIVIIKKVTGTQMFLTGITTRRTWRFAVCESSMRIG